MLKTDLNYLTSLVPHIRDGDMNAFTELYSATCHRQYNFALDMIGNALDARAVLEDTYVALFNSIPNLRDDSLIVAQLTRINFRFCLERRVSSCQSDKHNPESDTFMFDGSSYSVRRILELPYTEGQSILLVHYLKMKTNAAASLLEMTPAEIRYYISNGKKRLRSNPIGGGAS